MVTSDICANSIVSQGVYFQAIKIHRLVSRTHVEVIIMGLLILTIYKMTDNTCVDTCVHDCRLSRLLSAWFYRGHNPNNDFFQVRPEFKEIRDGKRPKITFAQYLEMHEYQNILTRMLGADSFPYRNITITDKVIFNFEYFFI